MAKVLIIGPAHPLRGGLATFDQRLAREFLGEGHDCSIVSFSLQYPSILFPGKTQYSSGPAPEGIAIHSWINSINPLNWIAVGNRIRRMKPDLVIVRFWLPFMAPALGTMLRRIRANGHSKIICLVDNIIPHESRPGDNAFTKYFVKACDAFVTMSANVLHDLNSFTSKPAALIPHPLYDNFGELISKRDARAHLNLPADDKIILFFGFIRHYKGLDLLLRAMADERIKNANIRLLVAGEFYEEEKTYQQLISDLDLKDRVMLRTDFIPDAQVKYYFCSADCVVQPYRNATQSGVTPLAYHFEKPMIVTNVGGLPDLVPQEKVGLVCEPEVSAIADAILRFYQLGEAFFIPHLRSEKQKYAWNKLTEGFFSLAKEIKS